MIMKPSPWQQLLLPPTPSLPVSCRRRWTRGSRPSPPPCQVTRWRSPPAAIARPPPPHALRRCRPPWLQRRPSPARANERRTRRNASVCSARRNRHSRFPPLPLPLPLPPPPPPLVLFGVAPHCRSIFGQICVEDVNWPSVRVRS